MTEPKSIEQIRDEMASKYTEQEALCCNDLETALAHNGFYRGFDASKDVWMREGFVKAVAELRTHSFRNNLTCHEWADYLEVNSERILKHE